MIGRGKSRHCQTWLERRFSWTENLQRKQNWTAKSTQILKKMLEKNIKLVFVIGAALWAEKLGPLPWKLQELKKYPRKLVVAVNLRGHLIRGLNRKGA